MPHKRFVGAAIFSHCPNPQADHVQFTTSQHPLPVPVAPPTRCITINHPWIHAHTRHARPSPIPPLSHSENQQPGHQVGFDRPLPLSRPHSFFCCTKLPGPSNHDDRCNFQRRDPRRESTPLPILISRARQQDEARAFLLLARFRFFLPLRIPGLRAVKTR